MAVESEVIRVVVVDDRLALYQDERDAWPVFESAPLSGGGKQAYTVKVRDRTCYFRCEIQSHDDAGHAAGRAYSSS